MNETQAKKCFYENCEEEEVFPLKIYAKEDKIELLVCRTHYYQLLEQLFNLKKE